MRHVACVNEPCFIYKRAMSEIWTVVSRRAAGGVVMNASCFVYEWACVAMCCSVLQCRCPRFTVSNNAEIGTYSPPIPLRTEIWLGKGVRYSKWSSRVQDVYFNENWRTKLTDEFTRIKVRVSVCVCTRVRVFCIRILFKRTSSF